VFAIVFQLGLTAPIFHARFYTNAVRNTVAIQERHVPMARNDRSYDAPKDK